MHRALKLAAADAVKEQSSALRLRRVLTFTGDDAGLLCCSKLERRLSRTIGWAAAARLLSHS